MCPDETVSDPAPIRAPTGASPLGPEPRALGAGLPGPIGMLLGGAVGTVAGSLSGRRTGERFDPAIEADYWRQAHRDRPYVDGRYTFDIDYLPAYRFGAERRGECGGERPAGSVLPQWDESLEPVLHEEWLHRRANSALTWAQARTAVLEAWQRVDRTYRSHHAADRYHAQRFEQAEHREPGFAYSDYRPAYRYGTWARAAQPARAWDESLERELAPGWERAKGSSRLSWERARGAVREAWHLAEWATAAEDEGRAAGGGGGDPDGDGR